MNPDDEINRIAQVARADQSTAAVVNIAADVAAYRARLLADRIPRALADQLTIQAAGFLWGSMVGGCGCGNDDG